MGSTMTVSSAVPLVEMRNRTDCILPKTCCLCMTYITTKSSPPEDKIIEVVYVMKIPYVTILKATAHISLVVYLFHKFHFMSIWKLKDNIPQ